MKNIVKILISVLLTITTSGIAQEYKFGKVSKEELLETSFQSDSSANAAILYESKNIYMEYTSRGFELVTEVYRRIKLYNKEGFDQASEEIFLYKNNSYKEEVMGLKGITFSIVNDKVVETKLKKDGIFKSEFSDKYDQKKFTMPSLTEGSIIEYKYKITSPFISNIDRIYLQYEIPIKKLEVKVNLPEYYNYKKFVTGYLPIDLKESSYNDKITLTSKTRTGSGFNTTRTHFSSNDIDYKVNKYTINANDVVAFIEEPYSGNTQNYISSIFFELSFINFPNKPIDYRSRTWEDVAKTIYANTKFGEELKKNSYYKEDIDQLINGVNDPTKRVALIYDFVKKKMNWNKKRSVITNKGVKKAYKEGTGNVAEINLMLTSMLDYAKIDAHPVIASTSDRAISLFPTLDGFNYVISRVKLPNGNIYYMDATDKYGVPNILSNRIIRGLGRVISKNGTSQMVDFRPTKPSLNRFGVQCEINDQGIVKGMVNLHHMDYLAHSFRVSHGAKDSESKAKRLEKRYGINELSDYTVKGVNEYGKGIVERFNFVVEDQAEVIDNEIFFSPLLFLRDKENVFKTDDRKYPVDFGYGFSNTYMINIKIPQGYEVAEFPKPQAFKLPENMGKFSFRSNIANGTIQIVVDETINAPVITADYYPVLKQFYNQLIEKENEQVVLKKI